MKKLILTSAVAMLSMAAGAQSTASDYSSAQEFFVKTKNAHVQEQQAQSEEGGGDEAKAHDMMNDLFPRRSLCEWTDSMYFMVIPDKQDMVMRTFYDGYGNTPVGTMRMMHKILRYQGYSHDDATRRDRINFVTADADRHPYYFEIPSSSFEDYCYLKLGVPALAYLNDVVTARKALIGKTLVTKSTKYSIDATYGEGAEEVDVPLGTEVRVVKVGVGTRSFPVKIVFEDSKGKEYFRNVAISRTNSGLRDDEFDKMDNQHHTLESAFDLMGDLVLPSWQFKDYVGQTVYTKRGTTVKNSRGEQVRVSALSSYKIRSIKSQPHTGAVILTLRNVSSGTEYTKDVFFKDTPAAAQVVGERENIFEDLFGVGNATSLKGVSQSHFNAIRKGKIMRGFTEEEVRLVRPDDYEVVARTGSTYTWLFSALSGKSQLRVTFNKKTRRVVRFVEAR